MVFFDGPPDLLGVDIVSEAGHDRLVFAAQHDHARVAQQVQRVSAGQARRFAFSAHIRRRSGSRVVVTVMFSQLLGPPRGRPRYGREARREKPREVRRISLPRTWMNRGERKPPVNPPGDPLANIRELVPPKG